MGRFENAGTDAGNASFVWLWVSEPILESSTVNGYRVRIGGFGIGVQQIYLERVDNGIPSTIIIGTIEIPSHIRNNSRSAPI